SRGDTASGPTPKRPTTAGHNSAPSGAIPQSATDGESSAPPPKSTNSATSTESAATPARPAENTQGSLNERIDSYRPDPARGEKEAGRWQMFSDGRQPVFERYAPSEQVLLRGDNGETFGLTPMMVDRWAADNGVTIPASGGIRGAITSQLYPKDPSDRREP